MTRLAVVTTVAGRHGHLAAQQRSLRAGSRRPDVRIVVSMGDDGVAGLLDDADTLVRVPVPGGDLPLSLARNEGAACALAQGADLLVFLDVDCLAGPELLATYEWASGQDLGTGPAVLSGPVGYLPPLEAGRTSYDAGTIAATPAHPARPAPPPGEVTPAPDARLFWSLSFAVTAGDWTRVGGFDEGYTGYGGEDTDFGQRLTAAGGTLWWVGGATAFHQWHPVSSPPVEHLADIVTNANRFHRRWGWFPMGGWLDAFGERGLAVYEDDRWVLTGAGVRLVDGLGAVIS